MSLTDKYKTREADEIEEVFKKAFGSGAQNIVARDHYGYVDGIHRISVRVDLDIKTVNSVPPHRKLGGYELGGIIVSRSRDCIILYYDEADCDCTLPEAQVKCQGAPCR